MKFQIMIDGQVVAGAKTQKHAERKALDMAMRRIDRYSLERPLPYHIEVWEGARLVGDIVPTITEINGVTVAAAA